jgi:L-threonylcarbamoyladenylate synthase
MERSAKTRIIPAAEALAAACVEVEAGRPFAMPTETVYGLAADAGNGEAVARIYEIKGRPSFNPLIVHVSDLAMAQALADFSPLALGLAQAFWPGPLTMVLPRRTDCPIHPLVCAGLDTVALRHPLGPAAQVIAATGKPLAAPSANRSGRLSPTTAAAVARDLDGRIGLIVDGGPCPVGLESTIVKLEGERVILLRPGGIAVDALERVARCPVERPVSGAAIEAPGMLLSHYAPQARLRLNATALESREALLAFGPRRLSGHAMATAIENLSEAGDLREAATRLFDALAALDRRSDRIAVEPVPSHGLGEAINDRLTRAAAPRDAEP